MSAPNRARRRLLSGGALLLGASAIGGLGRARAQEAATGIPGMAPAPDAASTGDVPPVAVLNDTPAMDARPRRLALYNLHTDESLEIEYHRDGVYVPRALDALELLLRDFRTGERHAMDPALFDVLHELAGKLGVDPEFKVISGYRSPATNAMLHERSSGVASRSMHLQGKAMDVRLAGVDCAVLATSGLALARGGVGYYRRSDFVHLDTGRVRSWRG